MTASRWTRVLRNGLSGIVLAGIVLSFIAPALSRGGSELHRCPPVAAAGPVLQSGGPHGLCGHVDLGACEGAVACASFSSAALTEHGAAVIEPSLIAVSVVPHVVRVADLFRVGPPTPPPNS